MAIKNEFSYENALLFAQLAQHCYLDEKQFKAQAKLLGFDNIKFFDKDGAQAYGLVKDNQVILAFRGTEPTQLNDIAADIKAFHVRNELGVGRVHKGFKAEVDDLWIHIEQWLSKQKFEQAFTCGHSLGGAMSTIAASRLPKGTICYNFGSPRVGTPGWVKAFNKDYKLYRFVNNNDAVTRVPFATMYYKHAGNLHYINTYGNIRNATLWQRIKDRFRGYRDAWTNKVWFDSFSDHSMVKYVEHISKFNK